MYYFHSHAFVESCRAVWLYSYMCSVVLMVQICRQQYKLDNHAVPSLFFFQKFISIKFNMIWYNETHLDTIWQLEKYEEAHDVILSGLQIDPLR